MSAEQSPSSSGGHADLSPLKNLRHDAPAGVVVALIAIPLALGIAFASGAPLMAGLISAVVAGLVVSWLSGSSLAVSGPAAGLTVIVLTAIDELGSWESFLVAVVLAGVIQLVFGLLRAGFVAYYFPSTVIKGLLAAIGLILILKQIPHAVGWDVDPEGDVAFFQADGRNTFSELIAAFEHIHLGATLLALVGLVLLVLWDRIPRLKQLRWLPGPLMAVGVGVVLNEAFAAFDPGLVNDGELLVQLAGMRQFGDLPQFTHPDLSRVADPVVWKGAFIIAIVASLETLLCIEAIDRLDPYRRSSDHDRELRAQGIGNIIAGLIGGLPMTAVIVRGSANVHSGARTRMAAFIHGLVLVAAVLLIPALLQRIPLSALAAVLLHVGYKLSPPSLYRAMWKRGPNQAVPFLITVAAILFTDLLWGVLTGLGAGVFFILRANLAAPFFLRTSELGANDPDRATRPHFDFQLAETVSFLNKAAVERTLARIPDDSHVVIDASRTFHIDRDVLEVIRGFSDTAPLYRGIVVELVDVPRVDAPAHELTERRATEIEGQDEEPRGRPLGSNTRP